MAINKKALIGKSTSAKSPKAPSAASKGRTSASKLGNTKQAASKVVAAMNIHSGMLIHH